ncbi:hypothetical protein BG015_007579 [Linnemannia schmuckeri]|uniref:Cytochrome b mRNA-processing protein 4 n=1 Tax=Linnemannia schmuckeri TaxID=64567 RepID=A0A9P5VFV3_9FUNG|nr:hypothetical protein BG015_007579 [Linnemannia schmuckeri]
MGNYSKAFAVGFGIVGVGYALMLTTVPTEEQLYEACTLHFKLSPELKKQYHEVKADQARRQAFSDVLRQAANDPEPMWIKKKTPAPVPEPVSK